MNCRFLTLPVLMLVASICWGQEKPILPLPDPGNATLTLDEYNKLVEMAAKPPKKPELAPLPYSIQHADLKLRAGNDSVRGTIEIEGEIYRKGISKVPLTNGVTVLDAHQNGKGIPLTQENSTHTALLPGPGEFSVVLDTGLPLRIEAGRASFTLPVPSAGSVQLALLIPGDHTFANITPGLITSRKSESGHTVVEATLVPGQPATFWWATREVVTPAVPREVRFLSNAKTLVSVSEAEMHIAVLEDITVVQGEPTQFQMTLPPGYEVTGVTGSTLDSTETQAGVMTLKVNAPSQHTHEFLISMERSISGATADAPLVSLKGAQRETGEVLVEGAGTMEIKATEGGGLKRIDVKEANPYLRSMAHFPPQAAFRYHRQPSEMPTLALDWVRFPDGSVQAAVAERAEATTLVTAEGKSLTEIRLVLKNQAQPFLKVKLPQGASILSAEVAGERVKPVQGPDGSRVPLLRPGFRTVDSYSVSFVFMHSGTPFAKKGGAELSLPHMDIPISVLHWEVFLPERYKVKDFGGDVIAANRVPAAFHEQFLARDVNNEQPPTNGFMFRTFPGQMGGYVTDATGAVIPNARIAITSKDTGATRTVTTDSQGRWVVAGLASGNYKAQTEALGFNTSVLNMNYDASQPSMYNFRLNVAGVSETVEVRAEAPQLDTTSTMVAVQGSWSEQPERSNRPKQLAPGAVSESASANVVNLQKRVAGVLPVAIDVPRAGTSFSFVRPLVLDEETKVTFSYKSR
jgi:hypothetical protein